MVSARTTHTAGPWAVDGLVRTSVVVAADPDVEICCTDGGCPSSNEDEANARLIAAAPEMLAALRLVSALDIDHRVLKRVDAAIAKAGGLS